MIDLLGNLDISIDFCAEQAIAPGAARRYGPRRWQFDGGKNRGGSTPVRGRVRSPHISGGRRRLSCRQPARLGSCAIGQTDGWIALIDADQWVRLPAWCLLLVLCTNIVKLKYIKCTVLSSVPGTDRQTDGRIAALLNGPYLRAGNSKLTIAKSRCGWRMAK